MIYYRCYQGKEAKSDLIENVDIKYTLILVRIIRKFYLKNIVSELDHDRQINEDINYSN